MQDPLLLKSGAKLKIQIAPFALGAKLLKTVAAELASVQIDFDVASLADLGSKDINTLKNVLFTLVASEKIEAALWECAKKCVYNEQRIVTDTFEPEAARSDYLPVMVEVMKANLRPFFSGLDLSLLTSAKPQSSDLKSE